MTWIRGDLARRNEENELLSLEGSRARLVFLDWEYVDREDDCRALACSIGQFK